MVLKLYAYPAGFSLLVALVLHEKKVPYEFIRIDILPATAGENKKPEYLAKNPFGQVPCLDDDGFILYESRAIAKYICEKYPTYGPALIPNKGDVQATARFDQALFTEIFQFQKHGLGLILKTLGAYGISPDPEGAKKELESLEEKLEIYDQILAKQKYMAGDQITLVDLFHLLVGHYLETKVNNKIMEAKPNIARWWKDISSRPAWLAVREGFDSVAEY